MNETQSGQSNDKAPQPEHAIMALQDLALRLIDQHSFDASPSEEPQLLVGQLPDPLPVSLPVPEGSRIVGSLIDRKKIVQVVLDVPLPAEAVVAYYHERLTAAGWVTLRYRPVTGFTQAGREQRTGSVFCRSGRGPALDMQALATNDGFTDVRLFLHTDPHSTPCASQWNPDGSAQLIPDLVSPPAAQLVYGSGGGGEGNAFSTATLETDLALADVAAHFAGQLEQAGWARQHEEHNSPLVWSTWVFEAMTGEGGKGSLQFFVLQRPEAAHRYALDVRAQWEFI